MSSNIYRVNKKYNLDKIILNNNYRPICVVFTKDVKNGDNEFNKNLVETLLSMSKVYTYTTIIVIDFNDFSDDKNFYETLKNSVPCFIVYYETKALYHYDGLDNFIPVVCEYISKINEAYLKLISQKIKPEDFHSLNESSTETAQRQEIERIKQSELKDNNKKETESIIIQNDVSEDQSVQKITRKSIKPSNKKQSIKQNKTQSNKKQNKQSEESSVESVKKSKSKSNSKSKKQKNVEKKDTEEENEGDNESSDIEVEIEIESDQDEET